ncbi:hypothetical protein EDD38_0179 [Kitasatospora cineracea]|uniref:Uncharacterized protein n=2 Tax=Kitasatospora cineracea TaxID=88074 RepID=A0A3N4RU67_9ACTN|nr:hypothetical protein EDD39_6393 [Kitasatospora cineracea]RPE31937.1 hypothetical protein EDD38_0179 [Kitasatospora cineracea]
MPRMLEVSEDVRAEIGDDEAESLLAGVHAPDAYDCTSCRQPGDSLREPTSTVLFVGEETAVLAFAHARCVPSQVVPVDEQQLRGAVESIGQGADAAVQPAAAPPEPEPAVRVSIPEPITAPPTAPPGRPQPAVLGVTCGIVLCGDTQHAALVVEPTGPIGRPGSAQGEDEFLSLLTEHGFQIVQDVNQAPVRPRAGWSVLMAMGQLHAILQPSATGGSAAWWQAHQPLQVTPGWRAAAARKSEVIMYAVPAGTIGRQPREDLLRIAMDRAAARGLLAAGMLPLAGT